MSKGRILIVDTAADIALILKLQLENADYRTVRARNGMEALEFLEKQHFDLVLMEVILPDMRGLEVLEKIRTGHPGLAVIMMTAHGSENIAVEAMRKGAVDYIPMPFSPDDMMKRVKLAIESNRSRLEYQQFKTPVGVNQSLSPSVRQSMPRVLNGLRVFLCHASEDKLEVRKLLRSLKKWGHDPWLDEEKILPGQDWEREIRLAMQQAHIVLVCLSPRSEKRGYVQKELRRALDIADEQPDGTIFIIPVRLEPCSVPERLKKWQWVDLFSDAGELKLEAALQAAACSMSEG